MFVLFQLPPNKVSVLVVHCGGNDLRGTFRTAQDLADSNVSKFSCRASVVVFCTVVYRYRPRGMSRWKFRELADAFNIRLRERTADAPHLVCWAHSHLDRYLLPSRSRDGVHFNQEGGLRFYLSQASCDPWSASFRNTWSNETFLDTLSCTPQLFEHIFFNKLVILIFRS